MAQELSSSSSQYLYEKKDPMAIEIILDQDKKDSDVSCSMKISGVSCYWDHSAVISTLDSLLKNTSLNELQQMNAILYIDKSIPFKYFKSITVWLHFYGLDQVFIAMDQSGRVVYVPYDLIQELNYTTISKGIYPDLDALRVVGKIYPSTMKLERLEEVNRNYSIPMDYFPTKVTDVIVDSIGHILYKGEISNLVSFSTMLQMSLLENYGESSQPALPKSYLWIDYQIATTCTFDQFIQSYISAIDAFYALWDEKSFMNFGIPFDELSKEQRMQIKESAPLLITVHDELVRSFIRSNPQKEPIKWRNVTSD